MSLLVTCLGACLFFGLLLQVLHETFDKFLVPTCPLLWVSGHPELSSSTGLTVVMVLVSILLVELLVVQASPFGYRISASVSPRLLLTTRPSSLRASISTVRWRAKVFAKISSLCPARASNGTTQFHVVLSQVSFSFRSTHGWPSSTRGRSVGGLIGFTTVKKHVCLASFVAIPPAKVSL